MRLSYDLMDRRGDTVTAVCAVVADEPYVWRVEFWGPKGLRHVEERMEIGSDSTHKLALQEFVTTNDITATIYP